ncbi:CoA transferase subunit A [Alkalihalobacterium chitinilyticum]|uniref:CoA transferase subunit A n=1 Tax=Alkalihalobacterium chitinilyticum TaxID=2980103 RepID=A0ABT5VF06_9BACI|nr:CoA transferase subunit A [Alkalihalobacterium chitinilyticum]MDE5412799.1 CoA transferase subunit A [Alkalihalobacterium chitinilyticum]
MSHQKVRSKENILDYVSSSSTIMIGGFGGVGTPPTAIDVLLHSDIDSLTIISNDAGFPDIGIGRLVCHHKAAKMITTHIGSNPVAGRLMNENKLEIEFVPQGTFAERVRAGGVGLGGILVDSGLQSYNSSSKNTVKIDNKIYYLERPLTAEVSFIYAKKADTFGNLIYDKTARNMNPLMAMAGEVTIAEVEEIVPAGSLDPELIVTPGVFVDVIVESEGVNWKWVWE